MRLDTETREEIEKYLRKGMDPKKVLEQITRNMYHESNLEDLRSKKANRRHFVTRADIRRIQKMIGEETIRLASGDGASVLEPALRRDDIIWWLTQVCPVAAGGSF
ncbi:hypothetical protein B0H13DRAFT_1923533 [Mycena leptocephala]|nr:hypothetical protein B0H13DRAFT_1923533 [Mycena leptocephala]